MAMTAEQLRNDGYVGVYRGLGTCDRPSNAERGRLWNKAPSLFDFEKLYERVEATDLLGPEEGP